MTRRSEGRTARAKFVHLGERLAAIERIRAGEVTPAEAASGLGVDRMQVLGWLETHGNDRLVTFDELREPGDPRSAKLAARARRLAELLAIAERRVHELHLELISKEFGDKPQRESERVARAQPRGG
jgi:hypothetical protein